MIKVILIGIAVLCHSLLSFGGVDILAEDVNHQRTLIYTGSEDKSEQTAKENGFDFLSDEDITEEKKNKEKPQQISPKSRKIVYLLSPFSCMGIPDFYLGKYKVGGIKLGICIVISLLCGYSETRSCKRNEQLISAEEENKKAISFCSFIIRYKLLLAFITLNISCMFGSMAYTIVNAARGTLKDEKGLPVLK